MKTTISQIFQAELSRRLVSYKEHLAVVPADESTALREQLNHRYLCLQMAASIEDKTTRPAITKSIEQVHAELRRWMIELQRDATVANYHEIGRTIALITEWMEKTKPITATPTQLSIV